MAPAPESESSDATIVAGVPAERSFASGRYVVRRVLPEGGQKAVYVVHDSALDRECVLALIKTDQLQPDDLERLRREAQAMARLDHPNIVAVFDIGEEDGRPFFVCQYITGGDLRGVLRAAGGPLPMERTLSIAEDLCRALAYAHDHGIVHRDVKPANIWLTGEGAAKLGDFGLATALDRSRLTLSGAVVGTAAYMAPEQALGQAADARSDLYALGCVLYELVTGRPPFLGDDALAVISQHVNTAPVTPSWHNPEVRSSLEALVVRLLAKAPGERPVSAAAVLDELRRIAAAGVQTGIAAVEPRRDLAGVEWGRFVGRREEMEQLKGLLERALSSTGGVAMLVGEPGIGKTRLAEEFAVYAELRGARALTGRAYEGEASVPYRPFVEALRGYIHARSDGELRDELGEGAPDVATLISDVRRRLHELPQPAPLEGEAERLRLFESVTQFVRNAARARPLVLLLDDLHWADKPSLLLLRHLARSIDDGRVLIVGAYRDVELDRTHPLAEVLAAMRRERPYTRLLVRGLPESDVIDLIESIGEASDAGSPLRQLGAALYSETEGNPFFIREVVSHLIEERLLYRDGARWTTKVSTVSELGIPEGVREAIGRRLSRLGEGCGRMLSRASAMTAGVSWDELKAISGEDEGVLLDVLDEAIASQLISERKGEGAGHYDFTHALIRQTLYEELSTPRRVLLHRQIGEALERLYASAIEPHLAELAHHFHEAARGGNVAKALDYARRAGDRAATLAAWEEALDYYERALATLLHDEALDDRYEVTSWLRAQRGRCFMNLGRWREARPELEQALASLPSDQRVRRAEILVELSTACHWIFDTRSARGHADEALALARETGRDDLVSAALALLATVYGAGGDLKSSLKLYGDALALVDNLSTAPLTARASNQYSMALYWSGHLDESIARAGESVQAFRDLNDLSNLIWALPQQGLALVGRGRYEEAMQAFEEARSIGKKYGIWTVLARAMVMSGGFRLDLGDFAGAEAVAEEAREMARTWDFAPAVVSGSLDLMFNHARRGEVSRAEALIAEVDSAIAQAAGWHGWLWEMRLDQARGEIALAREDSEDALRWASEVERKSQARGRVKYQVAALTTRAKALAGMSRTKDAIHASRRAIALAQPIGDPAMFIRASAPLLSLEPNADVAREARDAADRIRSALPDQHLRDAFESSESIRRLLKLSA